VVAKLQDKLISPPMESGGATTLPISSRPGVLERKPRVSRPGQLAPFEGYLQEPIWCLSNAQRRSSPRWLGLTLLAELDLLAQYKGPHRCWRGTT
jgi:hypothetical protein